MPLFTPIPGLRAPALAFVAQGMVWAAFAAQVPVIKAQIGASDAQIGTIFLVASLGAVASVWIAPLVDRVLGARSVSVSSALLGLTFIALSVSPNILTFVLVFMAVSAVSGVSDIVMNARTSEVESAQKRSLMNLNHAAFSFSYAGTAVLTGFAREAGFGPLPIFTAVALVILVMSLFMHAPHEERIDEETGPAPSLPMGLVWVGGFVVMAGFCTEVAVEGWSALHIERELGGDATAGALGPAVLGLTMGIGRLFGQVLTRYIRDTTLIAAASLISALGAVIAALASTPLMAQVGFGVMGLGVSLVVPLAMGIIGRSVAPSLRVAALARASAISYAAFLLWPFLMGAVAEAFSLAASFIMVAAFMTVVSLVLIPLLTRRLRAVDGKI